MLNSRSSSSSCLTIVAFLVLIFLAVRFYSNTSVQNVSKTSAETSSGDSVVYQDGASVFNTIWSYAKVIANVSLIKNLGIGNASLGETVKKGFNDSLLNSLSSSTESGIDNSKEEKNSGLNSYDIQNNRPLVDLTRGNNEKVTAETSVSSQKGISSSSTDLSDLKNVDLVKEIGSMINYKKTTEGAEIIITSKGGAVYKLALPFKFLAN
jgi:hypothetical protein